MLDDFHSDDPKVYIMSILWHPHRKIETVTHMLSGKVEHGDTMGNKSRIGPENLLMFGDGDEMVVIAGNKGLISLLVSAKPINETVAWYGPKMINTQEELKVAFEE